MLRRKTKYCAEVASAGAVQLLIVTIADHEWPAGERMFHQVGHTVADRDDRVSIGDESVLQPVEEGTHKRAIDGAQPLYRLNAAIEVVRVYR